jgi:hypothetical protein
MPRLRVLAGPNVEELVPIVANVSSGHRVISDAYEGDIAVFLKDFDDEHGERRSTTYFDDATRKGCTWSIQSRGRSLARLRLIKHTYQGVFQVDF